MVLDLAAGDPKAFNTIFNDLHSRLCYFAKTLLLDTEASKDIVAEVMVKCWQKRQNFSNYKQLKSYLYLSTRNLCINQVKADKVRQKYRDYIEHIHDDIDDDIFLENVFNAEVLHYLNEALYDLPNQEKKVMKLALAGKQTIAIARDLGISHQTVRNTRNRGFIRLVQQMKLAFPSKFGHLNIDGID